MEHRAERRDQGVAAAESRGSAVAMAKYASSVTAPSLRSLDRGCPRAEVMLRSSDEGPIALYDVAPDKRAACA